MRKRHTARRVAGLLLSMLVVTGVLASVASATEGEGGGGGGLRSVQAGFSPAAVPAGATSTITAAIKNAGTRVSGGAIGYVDLTVPAGWTVGTVTLTPSGGSVTREGQVLHLRGIKVTSGQTLLVAMSTAVPCGSTDGTYGVLARDGDLDGDDDMPVPDPSTRTVKISGACGLRFVTQPPADIGSGDPFTTSVEVTDGTGTRATGSTAPVALVASGATLGGTNPVNAVAGLATFKNMTLTAGSDRIPASLTASSAGQAPATSSPVTVHGDTTQCQTNVDCVGDETFTYTYQGQNYTQGLHVVAKAATPTPRLIVDHFYSPTPNAADTGCSGDDLPAPVFGSFTALGRAVSATQTFSGMLARPTNLIQDLLFGGKLRACITVPVAFQGSTPVTDPVTGKPAFRGIAQPCSLLGLIPFATDPCQTGQGTDGNGNPTVTVAFPAYTVDPNMR